MRGIRSACVHQPNFAPYLGFFYKIAMCDLFGVMANVAYPRRGYVNRVPVGSDGMKKWWTVPLDSGSGPRISDKVLADEYSASGMMGRIYWAMSRAPYWRRYADALSEIFCRYSPGDPFVKLSMDLLAFMLRELEIHPTVVGFLYEGDVGGSGDKSVISSQIARFCSDRGCAVYVSGRGGLDYLDTSQFDECGVCVSFFFPSLPPGFRSVSAMCYLMEVGPGFPFGDRLPLREGAKQ